MSGHRQKGESAPNIVNSAIITLLYAFGNSHFLTVNLRACLKVNCEFCSQKTSLGTLPVNGNKPITISLYYSNRCLLFISYVVQ